MFDYNLESRLRKEAEGILNWLVEGSMIAIKKIEEGNFSVPEIVTNAVKEYQESSDTVKDFLEDYFELDANPPLLKDAETVSDIYERYVTWCDECGIKYKMIRKNLVDIIEKKNYPRKKISKGIALQRLKMQDVLGDLF